MLVAPGAGIQAALDAEREPRRGGTAVVATDLEPLHLNTFVVGGERFVALLAHQPVIAGSLTVTRRFRYRSDLVRKATVTKVGRGMRVTYVIDRRARWSDGRLVTARDYVFTWRTITAPELRDAIVDSEGYDLISGARASGPKRVSFTFRTLYAGWRDLFGEVLPAHCFASPAHFRDSWRDRLDCPRTGGRTIASGPFVLRRWNKGSSIVFERNERYWKRKAYLKRLVLRFVEDRGLLHAVRSGGVDVVRPVEPSAIGRRSRRALRVQSASMPVWTALGFNVGSLRGPVNALIKQRFVRRAIAHALDRRALVRRLTRPLAPGSSVLQSAIVPARHFAYRRHWAKYAFGPARARAIMERNGCRRADDGIFVCAGRRASFQWRSPLSRRGHDTFATAREQLRSAGIEVVEASPDCLNWCRPAAPYDIVEFALRTRTPDLSGWEHVFGCRDSAAGLGLGNFLGYCDPEVDLLLRRASGEVDQRKQADLVNDALARMANDSVVLPLYQVPSQLISKRRVRGLAPDYAGSLSLRDAASWWLATR